MKIGWPYFNVWVDLWLLQIKTSVMHKAYYHDTYVYFEIGITLFHKWGFSFNVYEPGMRAACRAQRRAEAAAIREGEDDSRP